MRKLKNNTSKTGLPVDIAGTLIILLATMQELNIDNRYSKYIKTACSNLVPSESIEFNIKKRELIRNKLFKYKTPGDIFVTDELINRYGERNLVLLIITFNYLRKFIDSRNIPIDKYGQIMVIYGMAKKLLEVMKGE